MNTRHALLALAGALALAGCSSGPSQELVQAREKVEGQQARISELNDSLNEYEKREEQLDERDTALAERADELDTKAGELDERASDLDSREEEIKAAEVEIEENTIPGDGVFVVGEDIEPGTYASEGGSNCYWARLGSTSGGDLLANGLPGGPVTVTISGSDAAFKTQRCGEWRLR